MNYAATVGYLKRTRHRASVLESLVEGQFTASDALLERLAFDQFHRYKDGAIVLADLVDGDDVRVIELGRGAGFLDQPGEIAIVVLKHFDGDHPSKLCV